MKMNPNLKPLSQICFPSLLLPFATRRKEKYVLYEYFSESLQMLSCTKSRVNPACHFLPFCHFTKLYVKNVIILKGAVSHLPDGEEKIFSNPSDNEQMAKMILRASHADCMVMRLSQIFFFLLSEIPLPGRLARSYLLLSLRFCHYHFSFHLEGDYGEREGVA